MRRSRWSGKRVTPNHGLVRLGTWREITARDYAAFTAGKGSRADGTAWERPDFPNRAHFVVTRGLEPFRLYEVMQANPRLLNIQVSVDVIKRHGLPTLTIPGVDRLRRLAALPKTVFRFKTVGAAATHKGVTYLPNVQEFQALRVELGLAPMRVLETPLRLGKNRSYQTTTPLEAAGWKSAEFLRCNSECGVCPSRRGVAGENRVLGCAVTPVIIRHLQRVGNTASARVPPPERMGRVPWTGLVSAVWVGPMALADIYAGVLAREPRVASGAHWRAKVREVVQRLGERVGPGVWQRRTTSVEVPATAAMAVA